MAMERIRLEGRKARHSARAPHQLVCGAAAGVVGGDEADVVAAVVVADVGVGVGDSAVGLGRTVGEGDPTPETTPEGRGVGDAPDFLTTAVAGAAGVTVTVR